MDRDTHLIWEAAAQQQAQRDALILIDIQNDFMPPNGSLAVKDGRAVIPVANQMMANFELVVATQDWHPPNHSSFASNDPKGIWPDHCVQGTPGAEFASGLDVSRAKVFKKGVDVAVDSYSGFYDNDHRTSTGMGEWLQAQGVTAVHLVGVATDYCVKFTALDAIKLGFATHLYLAGVRGVDITPGDSQNAVSAMQDAGVIVT